VPPLQAQDSLHISYAVIAACTNPLCWLCINACIAPLAGFQGFRGVQEEAVKAALTGAPAGLSLLTACSRCLDVSAYIGKYQPHHIHPRAFGLARLLEQFKAVIRLMACMSDAVPACYILSCYVPCRSRRLHTDAHW